MILTEKTAVKTICPILSIGVPSPVFCRTESCMMWCFAGESGNSVKGFCGLVAAHKNAANEEEGFGL